MGVCRFCGEAAGCFRSVHSACLEQHNVAVAVSHEAINNAFRSSANLEADIRAALEAAKARGVTDDECRPQILKLLTELIKARFDAGTVDSDFSRQIDHFISTFALDPHASGSFDLYQKVGKTGIITDFSKGIMPAAFAPPNFRAPVNLQKGEQIVWVFRGVQFYEDRPRQSGWVVDGASACE